VEVPNVSQWRRNLVGDLTSTLFGKSADLSVPRLPKPVVDLPSDGPCEALAQYTESGGAHPSVPTHQTMPRQGGGTTPASRYYKTTKAARSIPEGHRTVIKTGGSQTVTTKSAANRIAIKKS
jgi:phospholipase C